MTKDLMLQGTLGHPQIDAVVPEVLQGYEQNFPGQHVRVAIRFQQQLPLDDIEVMAVRKALS